MSELPLWVVLLSAAVFVAVGAGLGYMGRGAEPWGRNPLYARAFMWTALGAGVVISYWSEGLGAVVFAVAVVVRLALALLIPWRPPTTSPTPGSPPSRR